MSKAFEPLVVFITDQYHATTLMGHQIVILEWENPPKPLDLLAYLENNQENLVGLVCGGSGDYISYI
jgi:hypothetical protein